MDLKNGNAMMVQQKQNEIQTLKDELERFKKDMVDGNGDWTTRMKQKEAEHEEIIREIK